MLGVAMPQINKLMRRRVTRTVSSRYLLYLPAAYRQNRRQRWPLLLFLHGAGERGSDLTQVKKHGPPKFLDERPDFPFIVVSPQCPAGEWWDTTVLSALLDEIIAKYRVDEDRVYVTGLSMGGFGTWMLASCEPWRFAALVPICGGGNPLLAHKIKHLPIWVFHGAKDPVVPLARSEEMVAALRALGANVRFTVYPDAGHDSWTETYNNPALYDWLLQQRRPRHARRVRA